MKIALLAALAGMRPAPAAAGWTPPWASDTCTAHQDESHYRFAAQQLTATVGNRPGDTDASYQLTRCLYYLGEYPAALAQATRVIQQQPHHAGAYLFRARSEKMLEQSQQAYADYSHSIDLDPNNPQAFFGRAFLQMQDFPGQEQAALNDFSQAIRIDPKYTDAYMLRGKVYSQSGNAVAAKADYEKVLELDPSYPQALCNLGISQYALGQEAEAEQALNRCYRQDPDPEIRAYFEGQKSRLAQAAQLAQAPQAAAGQGSSGESYFEERDRLVREYQGRKASEYQNSGDYRRAQQCRESYQGSGC